MAPRKPKIERPFPSMAQTIHYLAQQIHYLLTIITTSQPDICHNNNIPLMPHLLLRPPTYGHILLRIYRRALHPWQHPYSLITRHNQEGTLRPSTIKAARTTMSFRLQLCKALAILKTYRTSLLSGRCSNTLSNSTPIETTSNGI